MGNAQGSKNQVCVESFLNNNMSNAHLTKNFPDIDKIAASPENNMNFNVNEQGKKN